MKRNTCIIKINKSIDLNVVNSKINLLHSETDHNYKIYLDCNDMDGHYLIITPDFCEGYKTIVNPCTIHYPEYFFGICTSWYKYFYKIHVTKHLYYVKLGNVDIRSKWIHRDSILNKLYIFQDLIGKKSKYGRWIRDKCINCEDKEFLKRYDIQINPNFEKRLLKARISD